MIPLLLLRPLVASLAGGSLWGMLLALVALELAVLLPAAALSYRFVERPFLALKRRRVAGSLWPVTARTARVPGRAAYHGGGSPSDRAR